MPILLICLTLVYAALSIFVWYWRTRRSEQPYPIKAELAVLGVALLAHGAAILLPMLSDHVLIMGFGYAVSLTVWLMLMMYFAGSFFYRLRGLQLLLYPMVSFSLIMATIFPGKFTGYQMDHWPFLLHIASSLLAYSLFGIVTLIAILILWLSRELHKHKFSALVAFLPPLLSLEKLMFQGMWTGFALLTVSVVSGTFFAETVFGHPATFNHKTVFGVISWLIYAGLLLKRSLTAWRGKKVAIWTIIGFISLMLAYIGSKFVLDVILHR